MGITRRDAIGVLLAVGVAPVTRTLQARESTMLAMSNRAHILVRPSAKEDLKTCFVDVLGCSAPAVLEAPGLAEPMLAFRFPDGGSVSVEFSDEAPDEHQARHGAWLELQSDDVEGLQKRVIAAGFQQLRHPATPTFYFAVPGGQVFGVVPKRR